MTFEWDELKPIFECLQRAANGCPRFLTYRDKDRFGFKQEVFIRDELNYYPLEQLENLKQQPNSIVPQLVAEVVTEYNSELECYFHEETQELVVKRLKIGKNEYLPLLLSQLHQLVHQHGWHKLIIDDQV